MRRARKGADREVEAGRAELALVAAGRLPVADDAVRLAREDVRGGAVDGRVAAPAPLVPQRPGVADAGDRRARAAPGRASRGSARASRAAPASRGSRAGGRCARAAGATSVRASAQRTTIPERLSFASAGWQTYVLSRNSVSRRARERQLAGGERAVGERRVDHRRGSRPARATRAGARLMQNPHCSVQYEVR